MNRLRCCVAVDRTDLLFHIERQENVIATKITELVLDSYERRARLTPGLMLVAPVAVVAVTLRLSENPIISILIGLLSAGVGGYLLTVLVGNLGRRVQDGLWMSWGGSPTTQLLRASSVASNKTQRTIWRNAVEDVTQVKLLSPRQESANPVRADETIAAAVGQIRRLGQDERYPLVAAENAQYGFHRNLYGARWAGRIISLGSIVALGCSMLFASSIDAALICGIVINAVLTLVWLMLPSEARTKDAAFRYGEQLLQAVVLESKTTKQTSGGNA